MNNNASIIIQKLSDLGYTTINSGWYDRVANWDSWYKGDVDDFHNYKVWNGQQYVECRLFTLGMGKRVPEDWANLLMNERVTITAEDPAAQKFLDDVFERCNFWQKMNELQEYGAALGTYAAVPRGSGVRTNATGNIIPSAEARVNLDYLIAPRIFPLSWENRRVTECAFTTTIVGAKDTYLYLQIHRRDKETGLYIIENYAYKNYGDPVELSQVPGLEDVPKVIHTGSDIPLFVIGRLNIANNLSESAQSKAFDYDSNPMGLSVFANSVHELKGCDIVYDAYVNEYKLGKKRIMVQSQLTRIDVDGKGDKKQVFDPRDVVFHVLPEDLNDGTMIHEVNMALRSGDLSSGLKDMLQVLGFKCGLGTSYYKFENGVAITATETIYNNQDLQQNVNKNKIILRALLKELCRILLRCGNLYAGAGLNEDTEITIDLDDSVFVNKEAQLADMRQDVSDGLLKAEIYVAQKYGVSQEQAREMMPTLQELVTEPQNEVE